MSEKKKKIVFMNTLELITMFIYSVSINYYSNKMVDSGFITKNYVYIIIFFIVSIGGFFLIMKFFKSLCKRM
jgi:hypothetical protein